jgi:hypothetical protein
MVIGAIDHDHFYRGVTQAARCGEPAEPGANDDDYGFALDAHRVS